MGEESLDSLTAPLDPISPSAAWSSKATPSYLQSDNAGKACQVSQPKGRDLSPGCSELMTTANWGQVGVCEMLGLLQALHMGTDTWLSGTHRTAAECLSLSLTAWGLLS